MSRLVAKHITPEKYFLPPTDFVPNSPLPVLLYRDVLPYPRNEQTCEEFITKHGWDRQGPVWGAIYKRHFHPNVHECYGIISGLSQVLMGLGKNDIDNVGQGKGLLLTLSEGDVIVHPAGTSHANMTANGGYKYLSFFPKGSPRWKSLNGDFFLQEEVRSEALAVPMPSDPVTGSLEAENDTCLPTLWADAKAEYVAQST